MVRKTIYNKLVRDKIPEIIIQSGNECSYGTLSDECYIKKLNDKLLEEVNEYLRDGDITELADVNEVILSILEYHKVTIEEIEKIRCEKLTKRGGFTKRILLKEVIG